MEVFVLNIDNKITNVISVSIKTSGGIITILKNHTHIVGTGIITKYITVSETINLNFEGFFEFNNNILNFATI